LNLPQILFELSVAERYETVRFLALGEKRPSEISTKLGLSRPETSRHLSRLEKAGLIEKSANGYKATMLGELAIQELGSMEFIIKQKDYFRGYMWEILPKSLLYRISVLQEAQFLTGVTNALRTLEKMISSSQQYFHVVVHEMPQPLIPPTLDGLAKGVRMKFILTQNSLNQVLDFFKENPQYDSSLLKRATVKIVDSLFACSGINESTATTGLINRADPHDHFATHYIGTSEDFRDWCREVFNMHEARAKPIESISPR
jgi:predicted transcriptional regulator